MGTNLDAKLIEEVKKFNIVYDHNNVDYKKKELREQAWLLVATKFKSTPDKCKKRWKNMRDTYKRLRRRELEDPLHRKINWIHYDQLRFLDSASHLKFSPQSSKRMKFMDSDDDETMDNDPLESCEEIDEIENDGSQNEDAEILNSSSSKLKSSANAAIQQGALEANFLEFLNKTSAIIEKISSEPTTQKGAEKHKTVELFEFLARKAIHANLPDVALLELESKVFKLVNETIAQHSNEGSIHKKLL